MRKNEQTALVTARYGSDPPPGEASVPVVKRCLMGTSPSGAPFRPEVAGEDWALPRGLWGMPEMDREAWNTLSCCKCCWSEN